MKYKWVIMCELEDTDVAAPFLIVETEARAEKLCYDLEQANPGYIYYYYICEEE